MSSIIRIRFSRGEEVKYISHLDLMKVFERAIRRSHIPIAYSQGFNPHPQMVFGLPLSVGVTSEAEFADFELVQAMEPAQFVQKLNGCLPAGLRIAEAKVKQIRSNIMASITASSYKALVSSAEKTGIDELQSKLEAFLEKPSIIVRKEGKNGIKDIDIKPMIYRLKVKFLKGSEQEEQHNPEESIKDEFYCRNPWLIQYVDDLKSSGLSFSYKLENIFCLDMLVSAGSIANLKPDLLVSGFSHETGLELSMVKIHRTGLYTGKEGNLIQPLDDSVLSGL